MEAINRASANEIIVDVRTKEEWPNDEHAPCSVNYRLDQFSAKIGSLKKFETVIIVCLTGARAAKSLLAGAGFVSRVENLGARGNIKCLENKLEK